MKGKCALALGAVLALLLAGCGTAPSPAPTNAPRTATPERCAALHWFDVRDAVVASDHYTYHSTDHIVLDLAGASFRADRTADGAYQAPDRAREVSDWAAGSDPSAGTISYPDIILIGDRQWWRFADGTGLWYASERFPRFPVTTSGGTLDDLLVSLQARAPWSLGTLDPASPTACVFTITSATSAEGRHFTASLWADAATLLPTHIVRREIADRTGSVSTFDMTIDTTEAVAIEPPPPDEIAPPETPQP